MDPLDIDQSHGIVLDAEFDGFLELSACCSRRLLQYFFICLTVHLPLVELCFERFAGE